MGVVGGIEHPINKELASLLEEYNDIFAEKFGVEQVMETRGVDYVRLGPLGPHLPPVSYVPKLRSGINLTYLTYVEGWYY